MSVSIFCSKFNRNTLVNLYRVSYTISTRSKSTETWISPPAPKVDEYVEKAVYPEIFDVSKKAQETRARETWFKEIQDLKTVEEKVIKVNMPKYYGFESIMLNDQNFRYDSLRHLQHWTRTQFEPSLPSDWCKHSAEEIDALTNEVKSAIEDSLSFQFHHCRHEFEYNKQLTTREKDRLKSLSICTDINRILVNALSTKVSHLNEAEVDVEPRHDAFWFVGGIYPKESLRKKRKEKNLSEEEINAPVDRAFLYQGNPLLTVRNRLPLPSVVEDAANSTMFSVEQVPRSFASPQSIGYEHDYKHAAIIPGFWPGSEHQFGQLAFFDRSHLLLGPELNRNQYFLGENEQNALHGQGILTSFAWLHSQACYQGFSTYNDITYPLTTQTVITNGQYWSFYVYQLNTMTNHQLIIDSNPKVNKCWGTEELKLFDKIDGNGKVIGLNTDVLRQLVRFYVSTPAKRDYDLSPYLGKEEQCAADIEHTERRQFLEDTFKYLNSNRPRHRLIPEVYLWEKIYKIDHQKRPMDARRRFFELDQNPFDRRLDDHAPEYIPKAVRPGGKKNRAGKFKKYYYP